MVYVSLSGVGVGKQQVLRLHFKSCGNFNSVRTLEGIHCSEFTIDPFTNLHQTGNAYWHNLSVFFIHYNLYY